MRILAIALLLLLPQLASAGVYMCVDPATGKTIFTDKGCATESTREKVQVDVANPGKHARTPRKNKHKAWHSQRDTSKSGVDYNNERRQRAESRGAVAVND